MDSKQVAVWVVVAAMGIVGMGCGLDSKLGLAPNGGTPALMTRTLISKEDGGYKIQFSLQDDQRLDTRASGMLRVTFVDYSDTTQTYYTDGQRVEKGDFKKYQTALGAEVWAYVFVVPNANVPKYGSNTVAKMKLHFELDSGAVFEDEDSFSL